MPTVLELWDVALDLAELWPWDEDQAVLLAWMIRRARTNSARGVQLDQMRRRDEGDEKVGKGG